MSPLSALARMHFDPVITGRMAPCAGVMTIIATTATTTITTGSGWESVRE